MYFALAVWYVLMAIGLLSIWLFVLLALAMFSSEVIEREFGYPGYFTFMAAYALLAVPLAATLNGGFERDFLPLLGVLSLGVLWLQRRLEIQHKVKRAAQHLAHTRAVTAPASPPPIPTAQAPAFTAAPSTLADDFDVPPQGRSS